MTDLGHWITDIEPVPAEFFGFVYEITNNINGRSI